MLNNIFNIHKLPLITAMTKLYQSMTLVNREVRAETFGTRAEVTAAKTSLLQLALVPLFLC